MKVAIIGGGGRVGSDAAFALQLGGIVREIALVDMNDFSGISRELTYARAGHRLLPSGASALMVVGASGSAA